MHTITAAIDDTVGELLERVGTAGAEVRDLNGRVLAYVLAPDDFDAYLYAKAHREADQHSDRIRDAGARRGGKTTKELLDTLNALPPPPAEPIV